MTMLFAVLALFISLGGLWFAADARRNADAQLERFVKGYVADLQEKIQETTRTTNAIAKQLAELKKQSDEMKGEDEEIKRGLAIAQDHIMALQTELQALTRRLPGAGVQRQRAL